MSNESSSSILILAVSLAGIALALLWATGNLSSLLNILLGGALIASGGIAGLIIISIVIILLILHIFTSKSIASLPLPMIGRLNRDPNTNRNRRNNSQTDQDLINSYSNNRASNERQSRPSYINNTNNNNNMAKRRTPEILEEIDQNIKKEEQTAAKEDEVVKEVESEVEAENQDLEKIEQMNSDIERLLAQVHGDFQEIVQHEKKIDEFVSSGPTVEEVMRWGSKEGSKHIHVIKDDIEEINRDLQRMERLIQEKNDLAKKVHSLEADEQKKFKQIKEGEEQLERIEKNVEHLLGDEISSKKGQGSSMSDFN